MNKHFLITGGTGFLGSNIIKELICKNYKVTVLVRTNSSLTRLKPYFGNVNIVNVDNLEECFNENVFDGIIHTSTNYGRKGESVLDILNSNVSFPLRLLSLAIEKKVSFFINTDTSLPRELNQYALSKAQYADWLHYFSSQIKVINVVPEYFYGPHDDDTKFITSVLNKLNKNVADIDFTEGLQERDFIYIDDVVSAYTFIIDNIGKFKSFTDIPLGSSQTIKLRELVELIKGISGNKTTNLNFGKIPTREGELMYSKADLKILNSLGWSLSYNLEEGLKKIIEIENNKK